jgi:hypothetical protein
MIYSWQLGENGKLLVSKELVHLLEISGAMVLGMRWADNTANPRWELILATQDRVLAGPAEWNTGGFGLCGGMMGSGGIRGGGEKRKQNPNQLVLTAYRKDGQNQW